MDKLKALVKRLENEYGTASQVELLQNMCELLLTEYVIKAGEALIEPLWVEAYYFHKGKFEDYNDHRRPCQMNNFGKLYLHTSKKISPSNRLGGVDIVLSMGEYCLSFLVKNSLYSGNFYRQVALNALLNEKEYYAESSENVLVGLKREHHVFFTERIGLTKESFKSERLAALPLDVLKKYPFKFKEKIAFEYIEEYRKNHSDAECGEEYRNILGYLPKRLLRRFNGCEDSVT